MRPAGDPAADPARVLYCDLRWSSFEYSIEDCRIASIMPKESATEPSPLPETAKTGGERTGLRMPERIRILEPTYPREVVPCH
jgi:hypothetical protein